MEIDSSRRVAVWKVQYSGYPKLMVEWYDNFQKVIKPYEMEKYELLIQHNYIILKIFDLELKDSGNYSLAVYNDGQPHEIEIICLELFVKGLSFMTH